MNLTPSVIKSSKKTSLPYHPEHNYLECRGASFGVVQATLLFLLPFCLLDIPEAFAQPKSPTIRSVSPSAISQVRSANPQQKISAADGRQGAQAIPGFPTAQLERQIEFWKALFTRYSKYQTVLHSREYPWIIYSVLDFSAEIARMGAREFESYRSSRIEREEARILASLTYLSGGGNPRNSEERMIREQFQQIAGGAVLMRLREAATEEQVRTQQGIRERFSEGIRRSGKYLSVIEKIFELQGLPTTLARIPLIESSFDYTAYSNVGAAGIWQFMRSTAKSYMRVGSVIDERLDPIIATRAAAKYLARAHTVLGAWPLAVTSYNHGVGGVARGVRDTGSNNLHDLIWRYRSDSWGFASRNFYVSFMAAVQIEREWKKYFPDLVRETPLLFEEVVLNRAVMFPQLARVVGISTAELHEYNRSFLKPIEAGRVMIPAGIAIKVPKGRAVTVIRAFGGGQVLPSLLGSAITSAAPTGFNATASPVKKGQPQQGAATPILKGGAGSSATGSVKKGSGIKAQSKNSQRKNSQASNSPGSSSKPKGTQRSAAAKKPAGKKSAKKPVKKQSAPTKQKGE